MLGEAYGKTLGRMYRKMYSKPTKYNLDSFLHETRDQVGKEAFKKVLIEMAIHKINYLWRKKKGEEFFNDQIIKKTVEVDFKIDDDITNHVNEVITFHKEEQQIIIKWDVHVKTITKKGNVFEADTIIYERIKDIFHWELVTSDIYDKIDKIMEIKEKE